MKQTTQDENILDKGFQVNLRVVYLLIAWTAVGVASILAVYYGFQMKFNDLQYIIRDLERRIQVLESSKPR